jgi:hypothetical protein
MLVQLIALGEFESFPVPDVVTPPERTIRLTRAGASASATQAIDPYNVLDYVLDLSELLENDEQFASATLEVLPSASLRGFAIDQGGQYGVVELDNSHILIWPRIDAARQADAIWSGQGASCSFEISMTTTSVPPRKWQKTAVVTVAQQ